MADLNDFLIPANEICRAFHKEWFPLDLGEEGGILDPKVQFEESFKSYYIARCAIAAATSMAEGKASWTPTQIRMIARRAHSARVPVLVHGPESGSALAAIPLILQGGMIHLALTPAVAFDEGNLAFVLDVLLGCESDCLINSLRNGLKIPKDL